VGRRCLTGALLLSSRLLCLRLLNRTAALGAVSRTRTYPVTTSWTIHRNAYLPLPTTY
jgi:hypothetical protein